MLSYWFRILAILLRNLFAPPLSIDRTFTLRYRVRALDCDGLRVMSAAWYLHYMDFVRWLSIARTGLKGAILRNGWAPVMGSQKIIYRRPLKRWQTFNIHLSLAGWDDRWVYHLHWFERQGEVYAVGITKAMFWKKDHPVPVKEVFRAAGEEMADKAPPVWIRELFAEDRENLQRLAERPPAVP